MCRFRVLFGMEKRSQAVVGKLPTRSPYIWELVLSHFDARKVATNTSPGNKSSWNQQMTDTSKTASSRMDLSTNLPEIRPLPETATRILAACDQPDATAGDLCSLVQCDPGISLRILRVANSSTYGCSGEVRSIQHAIVVLGFRALRMLTTSVAVSDTFTADGPGAKERKELWNHSMGCAVVATALAHHVDEVKPDEAFLAGVVHDAGKLVLLDVAADEYIELASQADPCNIVTIEQDGFGIDHQQLGLRCADEWGLPLEVADAIGEHHTALTEEVDSPVAKLTAAANILARRWGIGSDPKEDAIDLRELLAMSPVLEDEEQLNTIAQQAREQFSEVQAAVVG